MWGPSTACQNPTSGHIFKVNDSSYPRNYLLQIVLSGSWRSSTMSM